MSDKKGSLYIVSTPIGNLEDITLRALRILKEVDYILCEDTRHSIKLLNHYDIKKPLISLHKFNEYETADQMIDRILAGEQAALISDAGTPLLSDPGNILVEKAIDSNIDLIVIPGANALLPALIYSGFDISSFTFFGFLPKKKNQRKEIFLSLENNTLPTVFYVSPHELKTILKDIDAILPKRQIALSKEITKLYEQTFRGAASELLEALEEPIKGEYVMVIDRGIEQDQDEIDISIISDDELNEMYRMILSSSNERKDALKQLALQLNVPKRELYKRLFKK